MLRYALKYLTYKAFSRHKKGHGIHSPFVYSLIREVFNNPGNDQELLKVKSWHRKIRNYIIPVGPLNYGAGSQYKKTKGFSVKKMGISEKYGSLLFNLVKYYKPETIVELGTGAGISVAYLGSAAEKKTVVTVEGSSERISFSKSIVESLDLKNISFVNSDFDDFLNDYEIERKPFLAFIDGNHLYDPTIKYFKYFSEMADEHSIIVLDDIYWSKEMEKAWSQIKKFSEVSITIDLFSMGIVFFRKGISKQDFKIKF